MNGGYSYAEVIDGRGAARRIDRYLSDRYPHSTHAAWCGHLDAGRVLVDGAVARVGQTLAVGQRLVWNRPPWEEPEAPLDLPILHEDSALIVVAKPAGLPTLPGGGFLEHTVLHQLRERFPDASPNHRLGRWTSGALLCARTRASAASLTEQLRERRLAKRYRALATGLPPRDRFPVDAPIGPVPYPPLGSVHAASPTGRAASSRIQVLERRDGSFLCDVRIATGRPHQIRIHLAWAGHPLVGDPLYVAGGRPALDGTALPGDPGYLLHSAGLGFHHPDTGAWRTVQAPPPAELRIRRAAG